MRKLESIKIRRRAPDLTPQQLLRIREWSAFTPQQQRANAYRRRKNSVGTDVYRGWCDVLIERGWMGVDGEGCEYFPALAYHSPFFPLVSRSVFLPIHAIDLTGMPCIQPIFSSGNGGLSLTHQILFRISSLTSIVRRGPSTILSNFTTRSRASSCLCRYPFSPARSPCACWYPPSVV